jgi:ADP-heptose:LPS heptosyltransferase
MPTDLPAIEPERCLILAPRQLGRLVAHRRLFASLTGHRRLLVVATWEDHASLLDPTLLHLRLRFQPRGLDVPVSVQRETLDSTAIRALGITEAVLLEPRWGDAQVAAAAGIGRRVGFARGPAGWWVTHKVPDPHGEPDHHLEDAPRGLAEALGARWSDEGLHVPELWRKVGERRLAQAHLDLGEDRAPVVGLYLGAEGRLGTGSWPAEHFEELLRRLRKHHPDWQFIILTPDADLWQSVLLYERTGKIHPVIGPDLSLDGLAAALSCLDLFVAGDSWMLQLAAAVGTPTVGLFERHARHHAPRGEQHRYLERRPLKKIEVDEVLDLCTLSVDGETSRKKATPGEDDRPE